MWIYPEYKVKAKTRVYGKETKESYKEKSNIGNGEIEYLKTDAI